MQYLVQDGEGGLGVPVGGVGHPAAGLGENRIIVIIRLTDLDAHLHLVAVQAPELELLLKQRSAHVSGVVQLASSGQNSVRISLRNG